MAWTLVIVTVAVVGGVVVVLARQGSPGRLSEEDPRGQGDGRPGPVGRPAGPAAEPMGVDEPGQPTVAPHREAGSGPPPASPETGDDPVSSLDPDAPAGPPPTATPDPERPVDPDAEAVEEEGRPTDVPEEERAVPEDVNEHVAEEPVPEDEEPGL